MLWLQGQLFILQPYNFLGEAIFVEIVAVYKKIISLSVYSTIYLYHFA